MSYTSFADEAAGKSQDELLELFLDEYSQFQGAEAAAITSAWSYLCQVSEGRVDSQNQPYCIHGMRVAAILAERKLALWRQGSTMRLVRRKLCRSKVLGM